MDNYKKKFGKHLQVLRKKRNYTQWKLAEIIGVDSKYLSRLESGYSSPSFDMLQKLAEALKVAIVEINKAGSKGVYHKNTCSRKISRLTKAVNGIA